MHRNAAQRALFCVAAAAHSNHNSVRSRAAGEAGGVLRPHSRLRYGNWGSAHLRCLQNETAVSEIAEVVRKTLKNNRRGIIA